VSESRWVLRLVLPLVALVGIVLLGPGAILAGARTAGLVACGASPGALTAAVTAASTGAWYRTDPVIDASGTLSGRRLLVTARGRSEPTVVELPRSSSAAGPFGRVVLYWSDDGSQSELRTIDTAAACTTTLATDGDVIRSATIDRDGAFAYEHRVRRADRADLGVFRRRLAGGPAIRVVPPFPVDDDFGVTFSTQLVWSEAGDRLAIHACGAMHCRLRVFDPRTDELAEVIEPGLGELVELAGDRAIVREPCAGLPCPLLSVDISTGRRTTLADDLAAGPAEVIP
jgi:hypothetical protein